MNKTTDQTHHTNNYVPKRCTSCVHWLGHSSKDGNDQRCNREYGHDVKHGHFYSTEYHEEPYGHPRYVTDNCTVPLWGLPIDRVDDEGNPIGLPGTPKMVDAYIRRVDKEGEGDYRSIVVKFNTPYGTAYFNSQELRQYLMATNKEKKLKELMAKRGLSRKKIQQANSKTYKDMYGIAPRVMEGVDQMSPWQRGLEKVPTGIPALDHAFKGGLPIGQRYNISGEADSGKSSLMNRIEGAFLKYYLENSLDPESEKIGMIKPEGFDLDYLVKAMGLDEDTDVSLDMINDHCDIIDSEMAEASLQYIISFLGDDNKNTSEFRDADTYSYQLPIQYRIITLDSLDALQLADENFGAKMKERTMGDNPQVAAQARLLNRFFRQTYMAEKLPVTLFMISQYRTKNIQTRASKSDKRGKHHAYYTSVEMKLYAPKMKDGDITKEIHMTFGKIHTEANIKEGDTIIIHLRPGEGFTKRDNVAAAALELGVIQKSGSWIRYSPTGKPEDELKTQGTNAGKVADWLSENNLTDKVYAQVMEAYANGHTAKNPVAKSSPPPAQSAPAPTQVVSTPAVVAAPPPAVSPAEGTEKDVVLSTTPPSAEDPTAE